MKKKILLFTIFLTLNCYSQISFEKGYFITNSGKKTECLIRNIDWKNNPVAFEYKIAEDSKIETATIDLVKEFEIYNISKYIRETVQIDKSSQNIESLSTTPDPIFIEKQVLLKVLVQGKANLYLYEDLNLKGYFYNLNDGKIEELIFKKYSVSEDKIAQNDHFKQQLLNDLTCPIITINRLIDVKYKKNSLIPLFTEYNQYQNSEFINFEQKEKKDLFNMTLRPRINNSSLKMKNYISNSKDIDFGNKSSFGLGAEFEYILPFNKNKWSISIEPSYQSYKSKNITEELKVTGGKIIGKAEYTSIEIPITFRYYFFLNKKSKIFTNVSFIVDKPFSSSIELARADGSSLHSLDIGYSINWAMGLGYKLNDKFCLEIRACSNRDVIAEKIYITSDYKNLSFIIGYTLF